MKGLSINAPATNREKQVEALKQDLRQVLINVIMQYLDVFTRNRLLGVESMFRFPSREHKDSILSNYESIVPV
jgi:hypothetical protein